MIEIPRYYYIPNLRWASQSAPLSIGWGHVSTFGLYVWVGKNGVFIGPVEGCQE